MCRILPALGVNVVGVLTDQPDARHASTYWAVLKKRLNEEWASELLTNCKQLKMKAADGKRRSTDVANTEQLLRILLSSAHIICSHKMNINDRTFDNIISPNIPSAYHYSVTQVCQYHTFLLSICMPSFS